MAAARVMFDVRFLGGASIEGEQGPPSRPAVQRHRLALLALLAAAYPQGMTRDKLAALLWVVVIVLAPIVWPL